MFSANQIKRMANTITLLKSLSNIIVTGTRILYKSFSKTIAEEIKMSKEAARMRYTERCLQKEQDKTLGLRLEEAMKILNVNKLDPQDIEKRFSSLFQANQKSNGGSFYILSKIVRAKRRIDWEIQINTFSKESEDALK